MASGIEVPIVSTFNGKGIDEARRDIAKFDAQAARTGGGMARLGVAGVAMGAALGAAALQAGEAAVRMAAKFAVDSVQAFMEDDAAAKNLANTLGNLGLAHQDAGVEKFIQKMQNSTAVADDVLRPAMDRLVRATRNVTEAQSLLALAADISATKHISLESAANSLAKAAEGNTSALGRLGVGYSTADLKAMGFSGTIAALTSDFSGGAATAAGSYQGSINKITLAFGDLQESLGKGFFSGVEKSMGSTKDGADKLQAAILSLQGGFETLGEAIGGAMAYVPRFVSAFKVMYDTMSVLWNAANMVAKSLYAVYQLSQGDAAGAMETLRGNASNLAGAFTAWRLAIGATVTGVEASAGGLGNLGKIAGIVGNSFAGMGMGVSAATGSISGAIGDFSAAAGAVQQFGGSTSAATPKVDKHAAALARLKEKMDAAKKATEEGIKAFDDYASSTSDTIMKLVSIDEAATLFEDRQSAVKTALRDLVDYQATLGTEQTEAEKKKVAELQGIYQSAQTQAAEGGASIVDTFVKQAEKVSEFGNKMRQLLAAGLNETSFKEISAMNLENGMRTADAFLNGNISENIRRTNEAVGSVKSVADQVGIDAAKQFASVGIQMAVSMIEALMEAIGPKGKGRKALAAMMDDLASAMNRTATISVTTVGNTSGVTNPGVASSGDAAALATLAGIGGGSDVLFPQFDFGPINWDAVGAMQGFADGGMASGTFLVGEAGPEVMSIGSSSAYVTPNSALGGNNYSITVNAGVGDPREIGRSVVQYIKRFEQASGPVFASA